MALLRFEREAVRFDDIAAPKSVTRLEIAFCDVETLEGVERLANLEEASIHYARKLRDISSFGRLRKLRKIVLYGLPQLAIQFQPADLPRLEYLSFTGIGKLSTLRGIEKLKHLRYLALSRVKVLDGDYRPIVECASLERVFWHSAPFPAPALAEIRSLRPDMKVGGNSVV